MITESKEQLEVYQARLLDVAQRLEFAFYDLNRCPSLQLNGLNPNRRKALENIESLIVECQCLCRIEAQSFYYADEYRTPA